MFNSIKINIFKQEIGNLFLANYRVFHGFGQAKFPFGLRLEPIFNTAPAASKNNAQFKSGQN